MSVTVRVCLALSPQTLLPLVLALRETFKDGICYDVLIINTDYALELAESNLEQMLMIANLYDFAEIHESSNFATCQPRTQNSSFKWLIESIARHRTDAARLLPLKEAILKRARANHGNDVSLEFWCDEPIHYQNQLLRAAFSEALLVKYPHSIHLENRGTEEWMKDFWARQENISKKIKRYAINLTSGLQINSPANFKFAKTVTLYQQTKIAPINIDVSSSISLEQFTQMSLRLPADFLAGLQQSFEKAMNGKNKIFLLLTFGFSHEKLKERIQWFAEALIHLRPVWRECALVLKTHPSQIPGPENDFIIGVSHLVGEHINLLTLPRGNFPLEIIVGNMAMCQGALGDASHSVRTVQRILECPTFILRKSVERLREIYPNDTVVDDILKGSELV